MKWHTLMMMTGVMAFTAVHANESSVNEHEPPQTTAEVEQTFAALDRDEDERISQDEAQRRAELRDRFRGVDASGDGYLSRNEYLARPTGEPFE